MLSSRSVEKLQSKKLMHSPNVNSLLKISLGLILFTIISSALVYAETVTVNVDGTSYDIDYTTSGMTVSGVEADVDFVSLIFTVDITNSPGILDITFDRSFFDSIFEGVDDDFIILADGDEPTSTETETNSQNRTLNIELPAGTEEVEIIGSSFDNPMSIPTDDSDINKAAADKAAADKAAADKAAADKAAADKAAADKAAADKAAADKAAADKAAADDTPKTQCGPGTILKDGVCVVESTPKSSNTSVSGLGKDLGMGFIAAIVIAGVIAIVLRIAAKAH